MNTLLISSVPGGKLMNLVRKLKEVKLASVIPCRNMNTVRMVKAVLEDNGFCVEVRARRVEGRYDLYIGLPRRRELSLRVYYVGDAK